MVELVERVWEISLKNPQGFTLALPSLTNPTSGICVAYLATQNCFGRDGLERAIRHALDSDGYIGGWFNADNGNYYFDSVRVFDKDQMHEALSFAREQEQLAIHILHDNETTLIAK